MTTFFIVLLITFGIEVALYFIVAAAMIFGPRPKHEVRRLKYDRFHAHWAANKAAHIARIGS